MTIELIGALAQSALAHEDQAREIAALRAGLAALQKQLDEAREEIATLRRRFGILRSAEPERPSDIVEGIPREQLGRE